MHGVTVSLSFQYACVAFYCSCVSIYIPECLVYTHIYCSCMQIHVHFKVFRYLIP